MFEVPVIEKAFLDAAIDPSRWNAAMGIVAKVTDSAGAVLLPIPPGALPCVPVSESMIGSLEIYLRDGWYERDLRFRGLPKLLRDRVATDLDIFTIEEMGRLDYYRAFLEPLGLKWFGAVRVPVGSQNWSLSIQRKIDQAPFSPEEQKQLAGLSRRLATAGALVDMLGFARAEAALEAFDVCGTAAIMLDRHCDVIRANPAAEGLLGSDLQIIRRRVTPVNRDAAAALDKALNRLVWLPDTSVLAEPVTLPRLNGAPILAYPMRLESVSREALAPCRVMLVLRDLAAGGRPPAQSLRVSFALTAAEARLASRMAAGESLEGVANDLGITVQTARNQLKAVFAKTGVARQSELVALMSRMLTLRDT